MDRIAALKEFKSKMERGDLLTGIACATGAPAVIEASAVLGHDFVIIDAEHSAMSPVNVENLIRAAEAHNMVSIVKLKRIDEIEIRDALDFGALGVMAPHIRTPEDMRRFVEYTYFAPRGRRGLCGAARANAYSAGDVRDLVKLTNEHVLAIPVIEEGEAARCLTQILDVDDRVTIYDIGPVDMALSLGLDLDRSITNPSPELKAILDGVLDTLRRRGKKILYPTRFPNSTQPASEVLASMRANGVSLIYGIDTHMIVKGAADLKALSSRGASHA